MGIWNGLKAIFGGTRQARADYDAASDNRHLVATYRNASNRNQNRILEDERGTIRTRLNSDTRNNVYMRRIGKLYANFAVGTGPAVQFRSESNPAWAKDAELKFWRWSKNCDARGKRRRNRLSFARMLHIGTRRLFPDGEFILVMESAPDTARNKVSLRLRPVRINRRCTPLEKLLDPHFVDGIELGDDGEPVKYWFLKKDPGDSKEFTPLGFSASDFDVVPASRVIHVFLPDEFEQDTGEPQAAAALNTIAGERRFRNATLLAAETAAKFAVYFNVDNPGWLESAEDGAGSFSTPSANDIEIAGGTAAFLPPGYRPTQIDPKHPATNYTDFKRSNLAEIGLAADMPVNLVMGDSSNSNFASAQFDGWTVGLEISCYRQYGLEENCVDIVVQEWQREAELCGEIGPAPDDAEIACGWPVNQYWRNPLHQANADEKDMASGKKTLYDIWEENGKDPDAQAAKLRKQAELIASLPFKPSFITLPPTDNTEGTDYATGEKTAGK